MTGADQGTEAGDDRMTPLGRIFALLLVLGQQPVHAASQRVRMLGPEDMFASSMTVSRARSLSETAVP